VPGARRQGALVGTAGRPKPQARGPAVLLVSR
jgi:hypothetical protein